MVSAMHVEESTQDSKTASSVLQRTSSVKRKISETKASDEEIQKSPASISLIRTISDAGQLQRTDSQREYNEGFNSQTLREAKDRYAQALTTTESDVDTQDDGVNAPVSVKSKRAIRERKIRFKKSASVRACENVVYVDVPKATSGSISGDDESENKDDEETAIIQKKTDSYHEYLKEKSIIKHENGKKKEALRIRMESKWKTFAQIEWHPIFTHKFRKALQKISVGFNGFVIAKLPSEDTSTSYACVFLDFSTWMREHMDSNKIRRNLLARLQKEKISSDSVFDVSLLEMVMDKEQDFHTQTLIAQKESLMAAKVFDNEQANDAGLTSRVLYFQDMTDKQYFDSLVERYDGALTRFKEDLVRLKS